MQPGQAGNMMVTGWQIIALQGAHRAGLSVSKEDGARARKFLDRVQSGGGAFYGVDKPGKDAAATAMGLLCRIYLGWDRDRDALVRGADFLNAQGPPKDDVLTCFIGTQLMHQLEGRHWKAWNERLREQVRGGLVRQEPEQGTWFNPNDVHAKDGGRLYETALSALSRQVYYRHLPLYEKVFLLTSGRRFRSMAD